MFLYSNLYSSFSLIACVCKFTAIFHKCKKNIHFFIVIQYFQLYLHKYFTTKKHESNRTNHSASGAFYQQNCSEISDNEITRCVVEQWINNIEENFYDSVTLILRKQLKNMSNVVDNLGILKPYSFVLENDDKENVAELYFADDNTVIIGGDIMQGLDEELEKFLDDLIKG